MSTGKSIIALALLIGLLPAAGARAASFGNPIAMEEGTEFSIGLEIEQVVTKIGEDAAESNRYLAKGIYRPSPMLSLSFRAGAADIDVTGILSGNEIPLDTNPRFAWGGGVRVEPWCNEAMRFSPSLVVAAEGLFLLSSGRGDFDLVFPSAVLKERFEADYKWREFQGTAAIVLHTTHLYPYAGISLRGVDGEVRRVQTDISGLTESVVADQTEDFGSSISPYLLAGLDYKVGPTFRISAEGFWNDGDDYGFFVGVSELSD